jgi:anthranilate 1,2-dioxygenase small subunit
MTVTGEVRALAEDLVLRSAYLIDNDDLEGWLDCFDEDGSYLVLPRDNRELGLPVALIHCATKARLRDRIVCLRRASKVNPHVDRHIVSRSYVTGCADGVASVQSNFMVVQTTLSGTSKLFCAGCYEDRIRIAGGIARFAERIAVVDTLSIPTMLGTPI